jgi:pSer/pThr/pTyr-binding forkhead associated (FHA) protein
MNIVYVGLTEYAVASGIGEPDDLNIGDAFRLLPGAVITFGRSGLCEVTISSDDVSRAHAMVSFLPGSQSRIALIDLDSRKGTWVGERTVPVQQLAAGAEFSIAKAFRFRCQPAPNPSRTSTT